MLGYKKDVRARQLRGRLRASITRRIEQLMSVRMQKRLADSEDAELLLGPEEHSETVADFTSTATTSEEEFDNLAFESDDLSLDFVGELLVGPVQLAELPIDNAPPSKMDMPAWSFPAEVSLKQLVTGLGGILLEGNLSQELITAVWSKLKLAAPSSELPASYRQMKSMLSSYLMKINKVYICGEGCRGYSKEPSTEACRVCGKADLQVKFEFFSIAEWLAKLYYIPAIATLMKLHARERFDPDAPINDVWQTFLWQRIYGEGGVFNSACDVSLAIALDGTSPYRKKVYSFWPIAVYALNLPPMFRFAEAFSLPWGIVPGPKKPTSLDGVMDVLVDELAALDNGINVMDSSVNAPLVLQARLLLVKVNL